MGKAREFLDLVEKLKGVPLGKTSSGKEVLSKTEPGDYKDFTSEDHYDALVIHNLNPEGSRSLGAWHSDEGGGKITSNDQARDRLAKSDIEIYSKETRLAGKQAIKDRNRLARAELRRK